MRTRALAEMVQAEEMGQMAQAGTASLKNGKEDSMSWNKSRFSQWEVEGEVRQRVGRALAEAEQGRVTSQCQGARERSVIACVMRSLAVRVGASQEAVRAWIRALLVLEKGVEHTQERG